MIHRWMRAAALSALLVATLFATCAIVSAQNDGSTNTARDIQVIDTPDGPTKTVFGPLDGFGSYGATMGIMRLVGGELASKASPRPLLQASMRYRFSEKWVGVGDFGMGWNAFEARGDTVFTAIYGTLGALRAIGKVKGATLRGAGGLGFYSWKYLFHGKSLRDPKTQRFQRGIAPGGYLGLDLERRVSPHIVVTGNLQHHLLFTADSDAFATFFDQNQSFLAFRAGLHYHFSPEEGIKWERKKSQKRVLESGKAGK